MMSSDNFSTSFLCSMQLERYEFFKAQDQENGHFDCALEIDGKKLYVHKYFLATSTEYFRAHLSHRWNENNNINSNNNVIKIEHPDYTHENFHEFICFLYSGRCNLTDENVFTLTDMADYYGVKFFKEYCDKYLLRMKMNLENIENLIECAEKYSLGLLKSAIKRFMNSNFAEIIRSPHFLTYKKSVIEVLSKCKKCQEDFLNRAYEWAHHQVTINKGISEEEDIKECITAELNGILGNISKIDFRFLKKFIKEKRFLFSASELYKIFANCERRSFEEQECFKILYELAKKVIEEKQKTTNDENFNHNNAIKKELAEVLPLFDFAKMDYNFLLNFVVENGFFLSSKDFLGFAENALESDSLDINDIFKSIYQLAEKQVLMKQKLLKITYFNFNNAVKIELMEVIPLFDVTKMSSSVLMEFVVAKNILSEEEKRRIFEVCIEIENNGKTISGIFFDVFGIRESVPSSGYAQFPENNYKFWCNCFFEIPSFPSTVTKEEGIEWYLCLDFNGALVVKHVSLLKTKDYLIAILETPSNFSFDRKTRARLTVR